jgi:hypothetical protein
MSKKKIICRLMGGLGNQLFQLQYALNFAKKNNGVLFFDNSFYFSSNKVHEKNYVKNLINPILTENLNFFDLRFKRVLERFFYKFNIKYPKYLSQKFYFENSNLNIEKKSEIILDGFWQDTIYIDKKFICEIRKNLFKKKYKILNNRYVCVHIRRNDYLTNRQRFVKTHEVLKLDYYLKSFEYLKKRINKPIFNIFTDDEIWAHKYLNQIENLKIISTKNKNPLKILFNMSSYQNYIIANSTFSWWAAVLSKSKKKKVILPKKWGKNLNSHKYKLSDWVDL